MSVSLKSQIGDKQQADQALRVSIPSIIQSFDSESVTCVVLPAVKGYEPESTGGANTTNLPLLVDIYDRKAMLDVGTEVLIDRGLV